MERDIREHLVNRKTSNVLYYVNIKWVDYVPFIILLWGTCHSAYPRVGTETMFDNEPKPQFTIEDSSTVLKLTRFSFQSHLVLIIPCFRGKNNTKLKEANDLPKVTNTELGGSWTKPSGYHFRVLILHSLWARMKLGLIEGLREGGGRRKYRIMIQPMNANRGNLGLIMSRGKKMYLNLRYFL